MHKLIILLILISFKDMSGQNWIKVPDTRILFSNYIKANKDNLGDFSFEYFRKGDSLISVAQFLSKDFLEVFTQNPKAFDDIYKAAYRILDKTELKFKVADKNFIYLDSIIAEIPFKTTVVINDRSFVQGENEFIWMLMNGSGGLMDFEPCYINIVFLKNKKKKTSTYISVVKNHCEI